MHKTTIYSLFLVILFLALPISTMGQQSRDAKPTRSRVENNKKTEDKKKTEDTQKDTKNTKNTKKDEKQATTQQAGNKQADNKQAASKPVDNKQAAKPAEKPAADTAAKKPEPPKPKPRNRVNTDNTQFDGIDISKHQGTIDWEELKRNPNIKYVYIKATEGSDYVDPKYKENIRNARKHGFKVGSYHFLTNKSSARGQFQNFIRNVNRDEQDLLPIIDVEVCRQWSSQQLRDSIKVFADLVEDYFGCKPMIYTSEKFFTKHLGRAFADYPLFIAKYSANRPEIGYRWILWQFSDCGYFKAVKGNYGEVDLGRFNKGCSIRDIQYNPSKAKPKSSVRDAVDHKDKPSQVNMREEKTKPAPTESKKQKEEKKKKAEQENKAKERNKKIAQDEAKKKAEAEKKEREKAERVKKEKARQKAREDAAKKEADAKAKKKAAEQKAREEAAKREADAKAKRKADAQKAKQQKAQTAANKPKKSATFNKNKNNNSKLSQTQRNDSIRTAQQQGRKTNKSSADND